VIGLKILHQNGVVYRDLKPENILVDAEGHIKMADFGLSKLHYQNQTGLLSSTDLTYSVCGTPEYVAPEILSQTGHNHSVDWWSFGILLYEMYTGETPFAGKSQKDMLKCIHSEERVSLAALRKCSHEFRLLIRQLLIKKPFKRLGFENDAEEVMKHSFFNGLDWEQAEKRLLQAPFKPELKSPLDTRMFEKFGKNN
jgi:serine/threonine protein kinase